jgi:hypothetical protein
VNNEAALDDAFDKEHRVGMRSGMVEAAAVCDVIAAQILRSGRKSKRLFDMASVATGCGDAIWAMREKVVP